MNNLEILMTYPICISPLDEEHGGGFQALYTPQQRALVGYGTTEVEALQDLLNGVPAYILMLDDIGQSLYPVEHPGELKPQNYHVKCDGVTRYCGPDEQKANQAQDNGVREGKDVQFYIDDSIEAYRCSYSDSEDD